MTLRELRSVLAADVTVRQEHKNQYVILFQGDLDDKDLDPDLLDLGIVHICVEAGRILIIV